MEILRALCSDFTSCIFCQRARMCVKYSVGDFHCAVLMGSEGAWASHRAFCPGFWGWLVRYRSIDGHVRSLSASFLKPRPEIPGRAIAPQQQGVPEISVI